jgi:hypothetical protein
VASARGLRGFRTTRPKARRGLALGALAAWTLIMTGALEPQSARAPSELGRRMNDITGIADPASRIREYDRLVGEFPGSALAAFQLALDLWRYGQRSQAGDTARRAIAIAPELFDQLPAGLAAAIRVEAGSADIAADRRGQLVAGFRITHRIAEDPRTLYYRAERGPAHGYVRVLRQSLSQDPAAAARFLESARWLQGISHPGLATILDAGVLADGCACVLVLPVAGELLSQRIWRKEPLALLAPALGSIAGALAMLHARGLYHLSIQPERVQVAGDLAPTLQLLDSDHVQGVTAPLPLAANGPVRDGVDPVLFMAPEIFRARGEVGAPADVYALGALAYLVLCGRPPLQAGRLAEAIVARLERAPVPVRSVAPVVPEELAHLVDAMLDKDPAQRPSMALVAGAWSRIFAVPIACGVAVPDRYHQIRAA